MNPLAKNLSTLLLGIVLFTAMAVDGYASESCNECHDEITADHTLSVHRDIPCLECHARAAEEDHETLVFPPVDCRQCHVPHPEKILHDAHTRVTCRACHIKKSLLVRDPDSQKIVVGTRGYPGMTPPPHQAIQPWTDGQCETCHFQGNTLGASAMVLPAKGLVCMPCHAATFSVNDTISLVTLAVFLAGMAGLCMVWFSGSMGRGRRVRNKTRSFPGADSSGKAIQTAKLIFSEVVLVKRLFLQSKTRWMIHALIFFPILFRLLFGLTALLLSVFLPDSSLGIAMMDKNHAMPALFFDFTGLMILAGSMAAIVRKKKGPNDITASLPVPGPLPAAVIGLIVLVGFILEGLRMAMTGLPQGGEWAFLGYGISLLFNGMTGLTGIYGYVWYAHGILTGAFIALIPFTRMSHIITAPVVLVIAGQARARDFSRKKKT